jgi:hypothetical protein
MEGRRVLWVLLVAVSACGRDTTDEPLRGVEGGIAALRWGENGDSVAARMSELEGVRLISDTVVTWYFAAWESPDTVVVPSYIRHLRLMHFRGGRWLGYPVAFWNVTIDNETSLRSVEVYLEPIESVRPAMRSLRRQLVRLYGDPESLSGESDRYYADGWALPAASRSTARTTIDVSQWDKMVSFEYSDRTWADSLQQVRNANPQRRVHVSEWERIKKRIKEEKGWVVE